MCGGSLAAPIHLLWQVGTFCVSDAGLGTGTHGENHVWSCPLEIDGSGKARCFSFTNTCEAASVIDAWGRGAGFFDTL